MPVRYYATNAIQNRNTTCNTFGRKLGAPNAGAGLKVIREKLKEIERIAEAAAKELFPFTFGDFEKEYILNNPSFLQRKAIKDGHGRLFE